MYEKQKGHAHIKGGGGGGRHSEAPPPSFLKSQLLEESVFRRRANNNPVVCRIEFIFILKTAALSFWREAVAAKRPRRRFPAPRTLFVPCAIPPDSE